MTEERAVVAAVGIGNALVGDDGAGVAVLERLRERWGADPRVLLLALEGDLYEIADHLGRAARFLFADAVAGDVPGAIARCDRAPRAYAPSFHQTDTGSVLMALEALGTAEPFPPWEIWGVTVEPPREVRVGLSPPVAAAVERLSALLADRIEQALCPGS
ncbi:MAG: hydrogenase maturation protease [Deltaproteobacteria bacterium]|nr:hydrogenase maturation protease [Deltaproteobacteria bacterium]